MAFAFDILLQSVAIIIIIAVFFFVFMLLGPSTRILLLVVPIIMSSLIHFGYFIIFEIRWNGQTPGKRRCQIRVIKESGRPITAGEAVARNLLRPIDSTCSYAVGLICMFLNKQHKRLGDYVAGTLVVYDNTHARARMIWSPTNISPESTAKPVAISPEELTLIEVWLNRRYALSSAVRCETASQIAVVIRDRTGIEPKAGESVETFLESIAHDARNNAEYR